MSTRPVHFTRTRNISGVYWFLETPTRSPAEYPHFSQQKQMIFRLAGCVWVSGFLFSMTTITFVVVGKVHASNLPHCKLFCLIHGF
nr:hypothetical protein [Candidatus Sigynarchaeota archaeon]